MTHALPASRIHDLDAARVLAQAGAIALNVALLMALMTPIVPPLRVQAPDGPVIPVVFKEQKRKEVLPPQPVEPKRDTPRTPTLPTHPRPAPQPRPDAAARVFEDAMPGDPLAPPDAGEPADAGPGPTLEPAQPETGAALRYAVAPPPPYPRDALRDGAAGTVLLEVLVDVDGRPLQVSISRSSGNRSLDNAARRHVLAKWRFEPAVRDGRAVQAIGLVPVEFVLGG